MPNQDRTPVLTERHDNYVVVTLNRPTSKNALNDATARELSETLSECATDDRIGSVVITGAGASFCAGGDLRTPREPGHGLLGTARRLDLIQRAVQSLAGMKKPTIAAVEGSAVGGGWSLSLACDFVIASENAFFAAPNSSAGQLADGGIAWMLTKAIGHHQAMKYLMLGERMTAEGALSAGTVTALTSAGSSLVEAKTLAKRLANGPSDSYAMTKLLVRNSSMSSLAQSLEEELLAAALNIQGPDAAEGARAFAEKRRPEFVSRPK